MNNIITKKEIEILTENQLQYSDEKIQHFINKGKTFLNDGIKAKEYISNLVMTASIGDVMENEGDYKQLQEKCQSLKDAAKALANQLYNIVEMYDITERPASIQTLEYNIYDPIENLKDNFRDLWEVIEALFSVGHDMKNINS